MLYVFYGDRYATREHSRAFVEACKKKRTDAEYVLVTGETQGSLRDYRTQQHLFGSKYIVFCDEVLGSPYGEHVLKEVAEYAASPHMFVLFEPSLGVKDAKALEKGGGKVTYCEGSAVEVEDTKALFGFLDVFSRGDSQKTLAAYHTLLSNNQSSVSILNILLWHLRTLCSVSRASSATEAGVKPFVFTKTKKILNQVGDPFDLFTRVERTIRSQRLLGATDEDLVEYIIITT